MTLIGMKEGEYIDFSPELKNHYSKHELPPGIRPGYPIAILRKKEVPFALGYSCGAMKLRLKDKKPRLLKDPLPFNVERRFKIDSDTWVATCKPWDELPFFLESFNH